MPEITNLTPFSADQFAMFGVDGRMWHVVVVSASFLVPPGSMQQIADEQSPVRNADEPNGAREHSSVRYEADIALEKPLVDVLVVGQAYAPRGRRATAVLVAVRVGDVHKELLVTGDRFWLRDITWSPSGPQPFERMPIVFERAFGGVDTSAADSAQYRYDRRNPVGVGYQGAVSADPGVQTEVPNVEYPLAPVTSPSTQHRVAGFGVVGRSWLPRITYAGTYDELWQRERFPLLPTDFNAQYFQAAPQDQQSATIQGGEPVEVMNLTPEGVWRFELPRIHIPATLWYDKPVAHGPLRLDTVLLEPDSYRVTLTLRAKVTSTLNRAPLREIIVGEISPGRWRARITGKAFYDWSNPPDILKRARV